MKKSSKVKNWNDLKKVSKSIIVDGKEILLVPMNVHGKPNTKVITSYENELGVELDEHEDNKFNTDGTIFLIGTDY